MSQSCEPAQWNNNDGNCATGHARALPARTCAFERRAIFELRWRRAVAPPPAFGVAPRVRGPCEP
eukprot:9196059-Pyramimonas_sp.AAC.1